uniref:PCI domain-containing protein n=1 Tax=Populus alba TaxID=43335 RepID=A0A4U5PZ03_POPAL|nr:hypothetical protein D5086_0000162330 [Populus alba]
MVGANSSLRRRRKAQDRVQFKTEAEEKKKKKKKGTNLYIKDLSLVSHSNFVERKQQSTMEIEEGQAQVIQKFVKKLQLLRPPPLSPTSSLKPLLTRLFSLFPRFYLSLISSSFKELRILFILIYFAYLVMEPGVITKVLSYNKLQEELEVSNVRELEDFLINDCMYTGIVKGKLNQLGRCFEVQFAAERDLMHGQLWSMIDTLGNWLATSDNVLSLIEEKIDCASKMCQLNMDHQQELHGRIDEGKKNIHFKKSQHKQDLRFLEYGDGFDFLGGPMEHEEDLMRSKRNVERRQYWKFERFTQNSRISMMPPVVGHWDFATQQYNSLFSLVLVVVIYLTLGSWLSSIDGLKFEKPDMSALKYSHFVCGNLTANQQ